MHLSIRTTEDLSNRDLNDTISIGNPMTELMAKVCCGRKPARCNGKRLIVIVPNRLSNSIGKSCFMLSS